MRYLIKLFIALTSVIIFWCIAHQGKPESFLVTEEPKQYRKPGQVRQESAQIMADILELESGCIAVKAQIQQLLCKHLRAVVENNKESFFGNKPLSDVQTIKKKLLQEKARCEKELEQNKQFLLSLQANMTT